MIYDIFDTKLFIESILGRTSLYADYARFFSDESIREAIKLSDTVLMPEKTDEPYTLHEKSTVLSEIAAEEYSSSGETAAFEFIQSQIKLQNVTNDKNIFESNISYHAIQSTQFKGFQIEAKRLVKQFESEEKILKIKYNDIIKDAYEAYDFIQTYLDSSGLQALQMILDEYKFFIENAHDNQFSNIEPFRYIYYKPISRESRIINPIELAIIDAKKNENILLSLEGRKFEEYIAQIFLSKGYEVEITARTRDGGRDLICLKNSNDEKEKIVVELKRWKAKIYESSVRSFVGANIIEPEVNKLVFVTTSDFTKPSKAYQGKFNKADHIQSELELNNLADVRKWTEDFDIDYMLAKL